MQLLLLRKLLLLKFFKRMAPDEARKNIEVSSPNLKSNHVEARNSIDVYSPDLRCNPVEACGSKRNSSIDCVITRRKLQ